MSSVKKSKSRAMPALPTSPAPCLAHSLQSEDWPIEAQKVKNEQIQAFYREYAKTAPEKGSAIEPDDHIRRITAALTQYTARGLPGGKALPEEFLRQGSEHILSPSPEELMELYATLLRDNLGKWKHNPLNLNPKMREVLTDRSFASSTLSLHDQLDQQFRQHHQAVGSQQPEPCGCGGDHSALDFPEDSYEDEPDEEDDDEEDEDDGEEDDEDGEDSMDDEEYDDDDEQDVVDGYAHHYEENNVKMMAYEEEKLKLETVRRVREEERRLKEEFRKKKISERLKQKQEKERILLLQRLRLEDEERRKREALEKQRREKLEEEMRRKREAAEADQNARSFLFQCTLRSQIETVKQIIGATPDDSCSLTGVPRFSTTAATRLAGWEFMAMVEGVGEVSEEKGIQETLLHVAVRVGCVDLAIFFIDKGAPLDALDANGLTPLHTAAKHVAPFEVCKTLVEKTAHHIDRTCIVSGRTALHYAAMNGYADLVALLLYHHARINAQDLKGNTPESLAKSGLESTLSEKPTKTNSKQANTLKAQRYRATMQHLQKAIAAIKEAQSRKDAQLEEQRRKDEALAREEAEKDKAARRKQEEKLEADLRRRLEEEKELERLKAMASDPSGNSNNSNKKKKKKKGKAGNDAPAAVKETPAVTSSSKADNYAESAMATPATSLSGMKAVHGSVTNQAPNASTPPPTPSTSLTSPPSSGSAPKTPLLTAQAATSKPAAATVVATSQPSPATPASASSQLVPPRIPKPKTSYRPSQLVVTRMTDMGFPLRESRKALIQTEGRVEDAIDLLTSGAQLADDSEDEAEQAAERARTKAKSNVANMARVAQMRPQDSYVNGHNSSAVRATQQPVLASMHQSPHAHAHAQHSAYQRPANNSAPGMHAPPQRSTNHPVQILQRNQPQVQPRSAPTQVLQRPPLHVQSPQAPASAQSPAPRRSLSNQGALPPMSSPASHSATTIASFIAPRTAQPVPPTRVPYSYGPSPTSSQNANAKHQQEQPSSSGTANRVPVTPTMPAMERTSSERGSTGDLGHLGMTRKFANLDIGDSQSFGAASGFSAFPTAASTWDVNMGNKSMASPVSLELPAPISTGYQPSSMAGHNPWATSGLSLPGPPLLQSVGENGLNSSFGSSFLTSLPAAHHQQQTQQHPSHLHQLQRHQDQHQPQNQPQRHTSRAGAIGSPLSPLEGYNEVDLDLGNAGGEMIKDVLAMTGVIDSDEFVKFEAEYSLLDSTLSDGSLGAAASSRAVGGGRGSGSGSSSGQQMSNLWGGGGSGAGNHDGLPSPIGTVNGHAFSSSRRGLDSGFDTSNFNGSLTDSQGASEYSQWNSGFALDQAMYPSSRQQQSGSSAFADSFFGSTAGLGGSSFGMHPHQTAHQHHQQQQQPHHVHHHHQHSHSMQQPRSPFEYSTFGGLSGSDPNGNSSSSGGGGNASQSSSMTSPTQPSAYGSIGAIGSSRHQAAPSRPASSSTKSSPNQY
ncbi:hypothetical protein EC968_001826 [Mortierella alpina]|nr:hypothetical protein EC968_001826 [Mortierella alpina]